MADAPPAEAVPDICVREEAVRLGFIPGVTTNVDQLAWLGQPSQTVLSGVFAVSAMQNILHLAIGAAGYFLARPYAGARAYLLIGGAVYLALWLYGVFVEQAPAPTSCCSTVPTSGCTWASAR